MQTAVTSPPDDLKLGPAVICRIGRNQFALPARQVESMVRLPAVTPVPHSPSYVRGVMNLRGRVLRVVDLRSRLGLVELRRETEAFVETLRARQRDHEKWVEELEASARGGRQFTLERDPTRCAFGRWLVNLDSEDVVLTSMLRRFDRPHRRLHAAAHDVEKLVADGDLNAAVALVASLRSGVVTHLLSLFRDTEDTYQRTQREIALVVRSSNGATAIVVDEVLSVEPLASLPEEVARNAMRGLESTDVVTGIARRAKGEAVVILLDDVALVDG